MFDTDPTFLRTGIASSVRSLWNYQPGAFSDPVFSKHHSEKEPQKNKLLGQHFHLEKQHKHDTKTPIINSKKFLNTAVEPGLRLHRTLAMIRMSWHQRAGVASVPLDPKRSEPSYVAHWPCRTSGGGAAFISRDQNTGNGARFEHTFLWKSGQIVTPADDLYSRLRAGNHAKLLWQSESVKLNRAVSGDDPGESGRYKIWSIKMLKLVLVNDAPLSRQCGWITTANTNTGRVTCWIRSDIKGERGGLRPVRTPVHT